MSSNAYQNWLGYRWRALDEIESAHAAIGGTGPGRRHATRQINHAYCVLLAAEFQGFCRALHNQCAAAVVASVPPPLQPMTDRLLTTGRQLDRGNATPATLGADFGRFDIPFWPTLIAADSRVTTGQQQLTRLNDWRNAIAHNDYDPNRLGGTIVLRLAEVRRLRRACRHLARAFDTTLRVELTRRTGRPPW